jgi:hypothetical protein
VGDVSGGGLPQVVVLPDVSGDGNSDIAVASGRKLQVITPPHSTRFSLLPGISGEEVARTQEMTPTIENVDKAYFCPTHRTPTSNIKH